MLILFVYFIFLDSDFIFLDSMHEQCGYLLEAKIDGARGKFAFLDGDRVLNLPMFYLQGSIPASCGPCSV